MNLILLEPEQLLDNSRARIQGRAFRHIRDVHRAGPGDELRVGTLNGRMGRGMIETIGEDALVMSIELNAAAPPPLPVRLILALPRPKVLNRTIAAAVSMGIHDIDVINAWRVDKAYWETPKLSAANLRLQSILGLEQAVDTMLPTIRLHRLFAPFVRNELPKDLPGKRALLAHPEAADAAPRRVTEPVILAIGPERGFIDREVSTFRDIGFEVVSFGPRVLRVETALALLIGRLF
jgi:RsmE family RNA methyltransferase